MTPGAAALLVWAIGTVATAAYVTTHALGLEQADPLLLCDRCRDRRRGWMSVAPPIRDWSPYLLPLVIVVVSAAWPIGWPIRLWRAIRRGTLRHSCQAAREATRG